MICCAAEPQSLLLNYCLQILPSVFSVYLQHSRTVVVTDARLVGAEILKSKMNKFYSTAQFVSSYRYIAEATPIFLRIHAFDPVSLLG